MSAEESALISCVDHSEEKQDPLCSYMWRKKNKTSNTSDLLRERKNWETLESDDAFV